ncbi:MAG: AIR synthase-related protein, partial [Anaerolineales bacterium]
QKADDADVAEVINWMRRLNRNAADLAVEFGVHGGTDITGFSLLGHATEMAETSGVQLALNFARIPFVSNAARYAEEFTFPGGAFDNRIYFGDKVDFTVSLEEWEQMLLFDPQTSGGLLLSLPAEKRDAFFRRAKEIELPLWEIGEVIDGEGIVVRA